MKCVHHVLSHRLTLGYHTTLDVQTKHVEGEIFTRSIVSPNFPFSAPTLLVGQQEGQAACKKGC